ncbi:MAG TPA: hypothetical protein VMV01_09115 [Planctomycetota bacterium]|nr:hypothetical protein [Planctomycetota bacterium]
MILGSGCLGVRALDGGAIAEALAATGLRRVLLVARPGARPAGLAGLPASGVRVGWNERSGGCELARAARASRLVLEPSATLELEDACRELHALGRAHAGLALAVTPAPAGPLAEPESLRLLLEDLASMRAGYWHRPARAHRLGRPDSDWLQPLSRWLVGLSLDDVTGSEEGLPPGLGRLDFRAVAGWSGRSLDVVIDLQPLADVRLLRFAVDALAAAGFA